MKKNIMFLFVLAVIGGIIVFCTCTINEPVGIEVSGVYYNECTDDVYYWGEGEHVYKTIYFIGVDLNSKLESVQFDKVDWKSVCRAENNEILMYKNQGGNIKVDIFFRLRLKNPYDPTVDINKSIFFNDCNFTVTSYTGGEFGHTDESTGYISTWSKVINFNYLYK